MKNENVIIMKAPVFIDGTPTSLKPQVFVPTVKELTYFDCRDLKEIEVIQISNTYNRNIRPIMLEPAFL